MRRGGVKDILFLSREGKFFKRLFELYRERTGKCANVRTHYFLGSRNSLMSAALLPLEEEKFECVVKNTFMNMLSANTFLISLGFSREQIELLQSRLDFNFKHTYLRFYAKKQYRKLLRDEEFKKMYEELRVSSAEAFRAYLGSFGLDYRKNGIVMFDVGWRGLVQDLMRKFLGDEVPIHGYYLGTVEKKPSDFTDKTGLLCSAKNKRFQGYKYYQRYKMLYEQICRADHGSAERYLLNEDGSSSVQLDMKRKDKELFAELFSPLQERIAETFGEICKLDYGRYSATESTISGVFYRAVKHMTRADYRWQLNAEDCHYDTFCRIGYRFTLVGRGLRIFAYRLTDAWYVLKYAGCHSLGKVRYSSFKTYRKPKNNQ